MQHTMESCTALVLHATSTPLALPPPPPPPPPSLPASARLPLIDVFTNIARFVAAAELLRLQMTTSALRGVGDTAATWEQLAQHHFGVSASSIVTMSSVDPKRLFRHMHSVWSGVRRDVFGTKASPIVLPCAALRGLCSERF